VTLVAAGSSGDDPITDLVNHRLPVWTPEVDRLVLRIVKLGGTGELRSRWNLFRPPPLPEWEPELEGLADRLEREARERGWEVTGTDQR
jgi:hypothetical protein